MTRLWLHCVLITAGSTLCFAQVAAPAGSATTKPASGPARFELPRGPFNVEVADVTLHDARRNKDIELRVRVPMSASAEDAPRAGCPLIVFSHGAGGSRDAFPDLLDFWASHGFASVAPMHADSLELRRRSGAGDARELRTREGRRSLLERVDLPDRVADCSLILDRLDEIVDAVRARTGATLSVDRTRLAIAGHSAGAFTAQLSGGVKARAVGLGTRGIGLVSIADDRFKAAIIISGQGTASRLLGEDSWAELKIPMLVITGSLDTSPPDMGRETPETRQHPFTKSRGQAAGGPPVYLLFIDGATHSSYQGARRSRRLAEKPTTDAAQVADSVAAATTLFLQAHLSKDLKAAELLSGANLEQSIPGKVRFERK